MDSFVYTDSMLTICALICSHTHNKARLSMPISQHITVSLLYSPTWLLSVRINTTTKPYNQLQSQSQTYAAQQLRAFAPKAPSKDQHPQQQYPARGSLHATTHGKNNERTVKNWSPSYSYSPFRLPSHLPQQTSPPMTRQVLLGFIYNTWNASLPPFAWPKHHSIALLTMMPAHVGDNTLVSNWKCS